MLRFRLFHCVLVSLLLLAGCGSPGQELPEAQDPNAYVKREVMTFVDDIRRAGPNAGDEIAMLEETTEYLISEKDEHSPEAAAVIERLGNLATNGASLSNAELEKELDEIEAAVNAL